MIMMIVAFLLGLILCLLLGIPYIDFLKKRMVGQYIREEAPENHKAKEGTPTTGGVFIIFSALVASVTTLFMAQKFNTDAWIVLITFLFYAVAGFQDDFLKLNRGKLIILKSKPSIALSTFALNIATNVALKANSSVAIFSLDMSKEQLVNRIISCETMIDIKKVRTAKLEDEDWKKIARTMKYLSEANIYIDDTIEISIEEIKNKCRKLKLEKNINLIIIDYLQLVRKNDEYNSHSKEEILEIYKFFKILANELNIPIIILSKLL